MLTKGQELLTRYFFSLGMNTAQVVYLVSMFWHPEAAREMLQYIADSRDTDLIRLSEIAYEISQKYESEEDEMIHGKGIQ